MKLTPLDIQHKTFKKVSFGGADAKEVDRYLELVATELEELVRELHRLQETVRQKDSQLADGLGDTFHLSRNLPPKS